MAPARASASRRIDKWLWCARRFKTRTLAAQFVAAASVRVTRNGATERVDKPGFLLREGDEVSYMLGEKLFVCTVVGFAERRGPPASARELCRDRTAAPPSCMATR
ncbi:MAG: RNA-binding S4 domain-containing protein [Parvularculaceae bacterium]|nr:RNA-binding S4 domain-containing protein [Parvularculaceae bacterium]